MENWREQNGGIARPVKARAKEKGERVQESD